MKKLRFSIMHVSPEATETLKALLDQFKSETNIQVDLLELDWETAHDDLNRVAYMRQGPDLSQIGSTWLPDYASMNALVAISPRNLPDILNSKNYDARTWQSIHLYGDRTIWAIPWLEETIVIFYRADIFDAADIDPNNAFSTSDALDKTAARLAEFGIKIPFLLPIGRNRFVFLHSVASWVWSSGGHFTSEDGSKMRFDEPEALVGMRQFFKFLRHISPENKDLILEPEATQKLLRSDDVGMTIGTLRWPLEDIAPQQAANWHTAVLPGSQFVGGSHLIAWNHTRNKREVFELVKFLMDPDHALTYARASMALPTPKATQALMEKEDPIRSSMIHSLSKGRSYRPVRMWGVIEVRLLDALTRVAQSYLEDPTRDLDTLINDYVVKLAQRLNLTLSV